VNTDDLIVQLSRAAGPVRPLSRPAVRLAQWTAMAVPVTVLAVFVIGPRVDVWATLREPAFVGLGVTTLVMALLAAASAFVLSIPGAERSPFQRVLPLGAGALWILILVILLTTSGDPIQRVLVLPVHWTCVSEIAGIGVVPGWALFAMLRGAAPLRLAWSAALASLAAVGLGAAATQFICPIDDPAHHLVGHVLPVAVLAGLGALAGRRALDRFRGPAPQDRRSHVSQSS
jgi:hypothetical protein